MPAVNTAATQVEEHLLLDASIAIFDPGLADYDEDILVYPDEPDADMYWVKFVDDTQPLRQIKGTWLVKIEDFD